MEEILYQAKQSIDIKERLRSTGTLTTTFQKYVGEANTYVWFGYGPQKILNHAQGQV